MADDGKDTAIQIDFTEGSLLPGERANLTVTFTPCLATATSFVTFKVSSFAGNSIEFTAKGSAKGYDVALSTTSIHFGEVNLQSSTNRLINVVNMSDLPTSFQFFSDKSNLFSFSQTEGTVKANSSQRIIISFAPSFVGNFYERVFCLVRHHKVLYVDLIGTCYDILTKPVPLTQRHVDTYRHKVIMGVHKKGSLMSKDASLGGPGQEDSIMDSQLDGDLNLEIPIDDPSQTVLHKEMLLAASENVKDVRLSTDSLDFAFTEKGRLSESKSLSVENKFAFPVMVNWTLLPIFDKNMGKQLKNPFAVHPARQEIPANSTFSFNVDFGPYESDSYFFQMAQCFVQL